MRETEKIELYSVSDDVLEWLKEIVDCPVRDPRLDIREWMPGKHVMQRMQRAMKHIMLLAK